MSNPIAVPVSPVPPNGPAVSLDKFSPGQKTAYDLALAGETILLTGPGGTGKSAAIHATVNALKSQGKRVYITGSTGIAAVNVGGMTIHSWLGTKIYGTVPKLQAALKRAEIGQDPNRLQRIATTDAIVIDEVSMLSGDYIDAMDWWLQFCRKDTAPFGGLQIIFSGDFLQLPPVETAHEKLTNKFAFQSNVWKQVNPKTVVLNKTFRQEDQEFVNHLLKSEAAW